MTTMRAFFLQLASVLVASSSIFAAKITLPLTKLDRSASGAYLKGAPAADRARAAALKNLPVAAASGDYTVPATNLLYVQYVTSVGVGSPPTSYNLVVDTGSSNTFVGTGTPYVRTSTSIATDQEVNVTYGTGYFSGYEYLDQVTLAPGLVITNQSIGDALEWADFPDVDGIVGVGPTVLTYDTLYPDTTALIPTVMDNALTQGLIEEKILGVSFAPATSPSSTNGALTYGGIDSDYYVGALTYTPVTTTEPASYYWGINITANYADVDIIPTSTAGIVDTGTTQILLADDFFAHYISLIPGAYNDDNTGLLVIPPSSVPLLQPLDFVIGGQTFTLDAAAQLVPEDQNYDWGGEPGVQYGYVGSLGSPSGEGLDFILGQKFMERYYAVFDSLNERVGFAYTTQTFTLY